MMVRHRGSGPKRPPLASRTTPNRKRSGFDPRYHLVIVKRPPERSNNLKVPARLDGCTVELALALHALHLATSSEPLDRLYRAMYRRELSRLRRLLRRQGIDPDALPTRRRTTAATTEPRRRPPTRYI